MFQLTLTKMPASPDETESLLSSLGALSTSHTATGISALFDAQITLPEDLEGNWNVLKDSDWQHTDTLHTHGLALSCPNTVFGNLSHPTTRLCLDLLQTHLSKIESPKALNVADLGCGSGVLSLVAWQLGCRKVEGLDLDENAIVCARENAVHNGIPESLFRTGDAMNWAPDEPVDLLMANIPVVILESLLPKLLPVLSDRGSILLSGPRAESRDGIDTILDQTTLTTHSFVSEEWCAWLLNHNPY